VIGKIARLFKLKGHDDVIRAARSVVDAEPNVRFLFVGDGVLRERLEQKIAAAGLAGYFQFTGLVPPERIPELISAADLVVHASLREDSPGAASGADRGQAGGQLRRGRREEVVISGETGFLVSPQDVYGLAAALKNLAADAALRDRLGQEGRRRFTDQFDTSG